MNIKKPESLIGNIIVLEPLKNEHKEHLRNASKEDESIWTYFPINFNGAGDDFDSWFDYTMERSKGNEHMPFAVRRKTDNKIVGTTRFYDMVPEHLRIAIGSSWYTPEAQGTLINSESRLLLLTYAFEKLNMNRVELITDPMNLSSRAAMKILGAVEEGVIRSHMIYKNGRVRDSVLFSIIKKEWPDVKQRLLDRLNNKIPQS